MKTITVQIGNSDDKLTQATWSIFVQDVRKVISDYCHAIYFFGGSSGWESWQNVAWIAECYEDRIPSLKKELAKMRVAYGQESVAYMEGETEFI